MATNPFIHNILLALRALRVKKPRATTVRSRFPMTVASAVAFGVISGLLITFNGLLVWVATGPRSLERAIPFIEEALNAGNNAYRVRIGEGMLLWDGWRHPVDIRLRKVDVITTDGVRFATFPDVSLGISLFSLAFGKLEPTSVEVRRPVISLYQDEKGAISFGTQPLQDNPEQDVPAEALPTAAVASVFALFFEDKAGPLFALHRFELQDASLSVGNKTNGVILRAEHVNAALKRTWQGVGLTVNAEVPQKGAQQKVSRIAGSFQLKNQEQMLKGKVQVSDVWPPMFSPLVPNDETLTALLLPIDAWTELSIRRDGTVEGGNYAVNIGKGTINSRLLDSPLAIEHAAIAGSMHAPSEWKADKVEVDFGPYAIQGTASITQAPEGLGIKASLVTHNVPVSHVRYFWPPSLAPISRGWVVENVTGGMAKEASIQVNIPPGALAAPALPEGAIDANMHFENAELHFLPQHLPVTQLMGKVHVSEKILEANFTSGRYGTGSNVQQGRVFIDDLNLDNPLIKVRFDAQALAADVVGFLSLPPVDRAAHLKLDKAKITGKGTGTVDLSFYYFTPPGPDGKPRDDLGVTFDIAAKMDNVSQGGFLNRFDIGNATGDITANNTAITFKGSGVVNGASASRAEVKYLFTPENGMDTFIDATGSAPVTSLPKFGYPAFSFITGSLGVTAQVALGDAREASKADINLKDAAIHWSQAAWDKPAGADASLTLEAEKKNGTVILQRVEFASADLKAKATAELNARQDGFSRFRLFPVTLRGKNLTMDYTAIDGGHKATLKGDLDASSFMKGQSDFTFTGLPALDLSLDLDTLTLEAGAPLSNVRGRVLCSKLMCSDVDVRGNVASTPFNFRIAKNARGQRTLNAETKDAGTFLNAAGIYEKMKGGELLLEGEFDDSGAVSKLDGILNVTAHEIVGAPTLAKLLSLASLTGFLDTLGGNGIGFKKLKAPFVLEKDTITLKDAKTHGSAIGLAADGTINFPGKVLDINGTLVPSYSLNTVLGNVPILGDIITKGGEGVFAAKYSMSGPVDNPEISVNPLSILTPGFLRGLFDVSDKTPNADKSDTDPKKN